MVFQSGFLVLKAYLFVNKPLFVSRFFYFRNKNVYKTLAIPVDYFSLAPEAQSGVAVYSLLFNKILSGYASLSSVRKNTP